MTKGQSLPLTRCKINAVAQPKLGRVRSADTEPMHREPHAQLWNFDFSISNAFGFADVNARLFYKAQCGPFGLCRKESTNGD